MFLWCQNTLVSLIVAPGLMNYDVVVPGDVGAYFAQISMSEARLWDESHQFEQHNILTSEMVGGGVVTLGMDR